jgi:hypothetical protein
MARLARVVIPGLPHHVIQRGNRREAIFFEDGDHEVYMDLLAEQTRKAEVDVWEIGGHDAYSPSGKGAAGVPSGSLRRKCRNLNEGFSPRGMSSAITSSKFDFVSSLSHPRDEDGFSLIPIPYSLFSEVFVRGVEMPRI